MSLDEINASTATLAATPASVDSSTTEFARELTPPLTVDASVPSTSSDSNELNDSPRDTPPLPSILKNKSAAPSRSLSLDDNRDLNREPEVDAQIFEALKSVKDRLFVLKLGEQMESLIQERSTRSRVDLAPETTYQRLLIHRCAAYYLLSPENEPVSRGISLVIKAESRIPTRRLSDLVPAEEIQHPTFKIMRRSEQDKKRSKASHSHPGSSTGEDGDASDHEPSETGSVGGKSSTSKKHMTIAEREAAYLEARSRIFQGFVELDKSQRDASASSSSISLVSGSGSAGGGGSVSEFEDGRSTVATESEWSGPHPRDSKNIHRGGRSSNGRSVGPTSVYDGRAIPSVRGTNSPVTYPPYDHNATSTGHENVQNYGYGQTYPPGYIVPYPPYPYPPPQGSGQPPYYMYPYYAPYPYHHPPTHPPPHPPPHLPPNSDPGSPINTPMDGYGTQRSPEHTYSPYPWPQFVPPFAPLPPPHVQPPPPPADSRENAVSPPASVNQSPTHTAVGSPWQGPQQAYMPYGPPPQGYGGPYPPHSYYPHGPPPPPGPQHHAAEFGQHHNGNGPQYGEPSARPHPGLHSNDPSHHNQKRMGNNGKGAWSYGPGVSQGGIPYPGPMNQTFPDSTHEHVGPRLSSGARHMPTVSRASSSSGSVTPADDVSSGSSSMPNRRNNKRTYIPAVPSKHPLPARPDWAAGLKPHPTLHHSANRHHRDDSNNSSRNMSPARPPYGSNGMQQQPPVALLPTDFPPLSMNTNPEKRPPVGGVWTRPVQSRSLASTPASSSTNKLEVPGAGQAPPVVPARLNASGQPPMGSNGTPLIFGSNPGYNDRLAEHDRAFERPPSKGTAVLFNPKGGNAQNGRKRTQDTQNDSTADQTSEKPGDLTSNITDQVAALDIHEGEPTEKVEIVPQSRSNDVQDGLKAEEVDPSRS